MLVYFESTPTLEETQILAPWNTFLLSQECELSRQTNQQVQV